MEGTLADCDCKDFECLDRKGDVLEVPSSKMP